MVEEYGKVIICIQTIIKVSQRFAVNEMRRNNAAERTNARTILKP
jgi:hypothetical protein